MEEGQAVEWTMPTLYVENVPDDLYQALRERTRAHGNSIAVDVVSLLKESMPTPDELARRKDFLDGALRIRARRPR